MASSHWEVKWLHFSEGETYEAVNEMLASVAAGWEPFAAMPMRDKGWVLMLKRKVTIE